MKDREIQNLIEKEEARQNSVINLIASENIVSQDVMAANASIFTHKYAEGYPEKRYYGGNSISDELEILCQKRALELFNLDSDNWEVNVQALSGSPANIAILSALVPFGEKVMGMKLSDGGHLTHGHSASFSGKLWKQVPFGVDKETELIDYDELFLIAKEHKPQIIIAGFTAYSRVPDWKKFREIADSVGAYLLADISHISGLISSNIVSSPFDYADVVMTTTHKMLRGPRGALIFSKKDNRELGTKINKAVFPGLQGGPHMNTIAGIAVCLDEANTPEYREYAKQVQKNAKVLSDELSRLGHRIISGGTDTHLFLVDTWKKVEGISGKEASERLERNGIIVNMNSIPYDTRKPIDPSGIRIGTPEITTRGSKEEEMKEIARKIDTILHNC